MERETDSGVKAVSRGWIAPFFTIWIAPRATIRKIVDVDPNRFVVGIAWIGGALAALDFEMELNGGQLPASAAGIDIPSLGSVGLAVFAFVLGLLGVAAVYGLGQLYRWSGHILGGSGTTAEVRAAIAWAQVPAIYITTLGVAVAILIPQASSSDSPMASYLPWSITRSVLAVWTLVISLKTLGEVHRFSAWRGLGTILLGGVAIVLGGLGIAIAVLLAAVVARLVL